MAIKSILTSQTDFTGEFPVSEKTVALWRFNEATPDSNNMLADDSGHKHNRNFFVSGWSGTSANLLSVDWEDILGRISLIQQVKKRI